MILSGLMIFATCLWYAVILQMEFEFPGNPDQIMIVNNDQIRYEYGNGFQIIFFRMTPYSTKIVILSRYMI